MWVRLITGINTSAIVSAFYCNQLNNYTGCFLSLGSKYLPILDKSCTVAAKFTQEFLDSVNFRNIRNKQSKYKN